MTDPCALSPGERMALQGLRDRGYAVVIFNPDELEEAEAEVLEKRLVELGWDVIQGLTPSASTDSPTQSGESLTRRIAKP